MERETLSIGRERIFPIYRVTYNVQETAQYLLANGNRDRAAGVGNRRYPDKPVSRVHGYGPNHVLTEMLLNFQHKTLVVLALQL